MTLDQGSEVCELRGNRAVLSILNLLLEDGGDLPEPDGDGSFRANVSCKSPKRV